MLQNKIQRDLIVVLMTKTILRDFLCKSYSSVICDCELRKKFIWKKFRDRLVS